MERSQFGVHVGMPGAEAIEDPRAYGGVLGAFTDVSAGAA